MESRYGPVGIMEAQRAKINKTEHVRQLVSAMQLADIGWQRQMHNLRRKEQSVLCIMNHPRSHLFYVLLLLLLLLLLLFS